MTKQDVITAAGSVGASMAFGAYVGLSIGNLPMMAAAIIALPATVAIALAAEKNARLRCKRSKAFVTRKHVNVYYITYAPIKGYEVRKIQRPNHSA